MTNVQTEQIWHCKRKTTGWQNHTRRRFEMSDLKNIIDEAFERRSELKPEEVDPALVEAVEKALTMLDTGEGRVAEKVGGEWVVNEWLKRRFFYRSNWKTTA
jgi:hypothetical protein